jgi:hypothetical protein
MLPRQIERAHLKRCIVRGKKLYWCTGLRGGLPQDQGIASTLVFDKLHVLYPESIQPKPAYGTIF